LPLSIAPNGTTRWAVEQIEGLEAPLLVCEPVLTEAMYLLAQRYPQAQEMLFELLENGALRLAFKIEENIGALRKLIHKFRDVPMSLADACVVRMAEIYEHHMVLTLDADFTVYWKHGRTPLALLTPGNV
jgi:predicted nucleic acid-binding protein